MVIHLNTLWFLHGLDHGWSWLKLAQGPASVKADVGGMCKYRAKPEGRGGQGGTHKHEEEGLSPRQAGACLKHYLTGGFIYLERAVSSTVLPDHTQTSLCSSIAIQMHCLSYLVLLLALFGKSYLVTSPFMGEM